MDSPSKRYWFPAKRYGWGWSLPTVWQGWAVLAGYLVAIVLVAVLVPPDRNQGSFWTLVLLASAVFAVVIWHKGEPAGWHWGDK